jgi:hypothetical protein
MCLKTICTRFPYSAWIFLRVGPTLAQKGHWKSDHSTMLTGAFAGPFVGAPASEIW